MRWAGGGGGGSFFGCYRCQASASLEEVAGGPFLGVLVIGIFKPPEP